MDSRMLRRAEFQEFIKTVETVDQCLTLKFTYTGSSCRKMINRRILELQEESLLEDQKFAQANLEEAVVSNFGVIQCNTLKEITSG